MEPYDVQTIVLLTGAYLLGTTVKGISGFGALLVAVPLMSMVVEPVIAIALTAGSVVVSNIWQAIESGHVRWALARFRWVFVALVPASFLGSQFLVLVDPSVSGGFIGILVILFCLSRIFSVQPNISADNERRAGPIVGALAGVVGGATQLSGSVLIAYLVSLKLSKDEFVGTIALMYLANSLPIYVTLVGFGRYGFAEVALSVGLVAPALVGISVGRLIRGRVSQSLFERIVLGLLLVIGVMVLYRSI
jgi:uncharacterized membrane protein YfcA